MTNFSFAGPTKGQTDPDEIETYEILEDELYGNEPISVIRWIGNGYSPDNSWIEYTEADVVDPTKYR